MPSQKMTKSDSSRVQSSQAKGGNDMSSKGFSARAQSAGDRNNASSGSYFGGAGVSGGSRGGGSGAGASSYGYGSGSTQDSKRN